MSIQKDDVVGILPQGVVKNSRTSGCLAYQARGDAECGGSSQWHELSGICVYAFLAKRRRSGVSCVHMRKYFNRAIANAFHAVRNRA